MSRSPRQYALATVLAAVLTAGGAYTAMAADTTSTTSTTTPMKAEKQQGVVDASRATIENFVNNPELGWLRDNIKNAKAVMVIPEQVKGGFILGGSGGSGVALTRTATGWSYPAFITMGSITFGLQAGGQVSEIVLMAMTDKGTQALHGDQFKLGGDVSVAAGPVGMGAKAATADVIAFSRAKGLYGGLNVEGAMIKSRTEWNDDYYGKKVSAADILAGRASNTAADPLRRALDKLDHQGETTGSVDKPAEKRTN